MMTDGFVKLDLSRFRIIDSPRVAENRYIINDQGILIDMGHEKICRMHVDKDGYLRVQLANREGKMKNWGIHRLVALTFCDNPDPLLKTQVNHKNGDKTFNFADNLEWVTSGENTRHAIANGLRKTDGEGNGRSRYSEAFVRKICERYQEGLQPIDVYHEFFGPGPMRTNREKKDYAFLYQLKRKQIWPHVVSDYDYSTDVIKDPAKKNFMPTKDSRLTIKNIEWVCQKIQDGFTPPEIATMMIDGEMPDPYPSFMTYSRFLDIVGSIGRGKTWSSISSKYDFSKRNTLGADPHIYDESFRQLIDAGYTKNHIIETVAKSFHKAPCYIRQVLNRYLRDNGFDNIINRDK